MTGQRIRVMRRRRELAGQQRVGRFARRGAWNRQREWARRFWPVLVTVLVGPTAVLSPLAIVEHGTARGALLGAGAVSGVWLAVLVTLLCSGAAASVMAAAAEEWTAVDLRRLRRRGWRLVNGLQLRDQADIDHIAVGPAGVLVVET